LSCGACKSPNVAKGLSTPVSIQRLFTIWAIGIHEVLRAKFISKK
jgi:hypothetical protein